MKKLAASEKWTAAPPSMRSRSPNGVLTASKAIDPTTVRDIAGTAAVARCACETHRWPMKAIQIRGVRRARGARATSSSPIRRRARARSWSRSPAAGINFADTHATRNDYLAEQSLPLIPGAEVSGRTADGRRVAALLGSGGYAEKVVGARGAADPGPRRGRRRPGGGAAAAGPDRDGAGPALRPDRAGRDDRGRGRRRRHRHARGAARASAPARR